MDFGVLIRSFVEKIPEEQLRMMRDAMPIAKAAIDTIPREGDESIVFILKVKSDNLTLDIAATKIEQVGDEKMLVISHTIGETIKVIPEIKK